MPARYRIGIIGLGKMGWRHLETLRESSRWEIAWACDRDAARLAAARDAVPGITTGDDAEATLDEAVLHSSVVDAY